MARQMTDYEAEQEYMEMLNECEELVEFCGLSYAAGYLLRKCDPIAFRCGMLDWADGENIEII